MTPARTIVARIAVALAWFIATPVVTVAALLAIGWICTAMAGLPFTEKAREVLVISGVIIGVVSGIGAGVVADAFRESA